MSIQELESEVQRLSPAELAAFGKWFQAFAAEKLSDERLSWSHFTMRGLARAYSNAEPDYTIADIKQG